MPLPPMMVPPGGFTLDGVLDGELSVGKTADSASEQYAAIGSALTTTGVADGFFEGRMDEARIWNRALTQSEIRAGMNQAITSATGLVGRWGLNEWQRNCRSRLNRYTRQWHD